jgi:hypothetical protein
MEEAMDFSTPVVVGVLLALFTAIQAWINKGRYDELTRRIDAFERSVERRFDQVFAEMAQLRSDLLQVALAVHQRPQAG